MDRDELIERFPRVFHLTEAGAWTSIQRHGLLSTSALLDLFKVAEPSRSQIEARPRPDDVVLEHPRAGRAVVRDNRPLRPDILRRCLEGSVSDWCRLLNARVFLWATERRLHTHLRARGHRRRAREVITIDTGLLLGRHAESVTLCAFNSGSALYPNAPRRGADSFLAVDAYPLDAVAEVCVDRALANVREIALSVTAIDEDGAERTIWTGPRPSAGQGARSSAPSG
jgi:hypothetical protein